MKLLHYSAEPFQFNQDRTYQQHAYGFNPNGLWLSVEGDDDWLAWCNSENFGIERLKYATEVILKPDASVLLLDTAAKVNEFNTRFRRTDDNSIVHNIAWDKVEALYDGLIIAPYHWGLQLHIMWYYTWDCASGVIWNLSTIANVTLSPNAI